MVTVNDPRLAKGAQFKSELDGIPVIMEIDEVIMVDEGNGEAVLKAHVVRRIEETEE